MEAVKDVPVVTQTELFSVSSSFEFILNNQIYIYAVLILIVLIIIGWYLYNKYFNKKKEGDDNDDEEEEKEEPEAKASKKNKVKIESDSEESENIIDPKKKYYLVVLNISATGLTIGPLIYCTVGLGLILVVIFVGVAGIIKEVILLVNTVANVLAAVPNS
jgi:Ca2+/Na+ antiporter